jgi:hypothetical protein
MISIIKEHFDRIAGLLTLLIVIAALLALIFHGMKDETVIAILATGSIGIANTVAGVVKASQQSQSPQVPQEPQLPQQQASPNAVESQA